MSDVTSRLSLQTTAHFLPVIPRWTAPMRRAVSELNRE